ncbi:hypothetical protein INR49_008348 [Caranx melampygus]|nr:hypothetical protein INR49_008348 [Caranx melampygus]
MSLAVGRRSIVMSQHPHRVDPWQMVESLREFLQLTEVPAALPLLLVHLPQQEVMLTHSSICSTDHRCFGWSSVQEVMRQHDGVTPGCGTLTGRRPQRTPRSAHSRGRGGAGRRRQSQAVVKLRPSDTSRSSQRVRQQPQVLNNKTGSSSRRFALTTPESPPPAPVYSAAASAPPAGEQSNVLNLIIQLLSASGHFESKHNFKGFRSMSLIRPIVTFDPVLLRPHLHAGGLGLQFGQVVGVVLQLPPQVGVLLAERLHLVGELVVRRHVGHVHAPQRHLQEQRGRSQLK